MKIRITVMRIAVHKDLIEKYESSKEEHCHFKVGDCFLLSDWSKPEGFCESAWQTLSPFVMALFYGASDIYSGWMKNRRSVMISCNDGFRPVSFLVEALED